MAITSTYPIIVPKAGDLIVGSQTYTVADPVLDNPTRNFTVASVAALANAINLGYTSYVAKWSQTGATGIPVSVILQNNTGLVFTWTKSSVGVYDLTASASFGNNAYAVVSAWDDNTDSIPASTGTKSVSIKSINTTSIRVTNQDSADSSFVDGIVTGVIEIRIYS